MLEVAAAEIVQPASYVSDLAKNINDKEGDFYSSEVTEVQYFIMWADVWSNIHFNVKSLVGKTSFR